jgi:hypothetical protein
MYNTFTFCFVLFINEIQLYYYLDPIAENGVEGYCDLSARGKGLQSRWLFQFEENMTQLPKICYRKKKSMLSEKIHAYNKKNPKNC